MEIGCRNDIRMTWCAKSIYVHSLCIIPTWYLSPIFHSWNEWTQWLAKKWLSEKKIQWKSSRVFLKLWGNNLIFWKIIFLIWYIFSFFNIFITFCLPIFHLHIVTLATAVQGCYTSRVVHYNKDLPTTKVGQ